MQSIGASSGIGRGVAEQLLKSGDFVVLCARRTELLNQHHEDYPQTSLVHPFDVNDAGNIEINLINIFNSLIVYLFCIHWKEFSGENRHYSNSTNRYHCRFSPAGKAQKLWKVMNVNTKFSFDSKPNETSIVLKAGVYLIN